MQALTRGGAAGTSRPADAASRPTHTRNAPMVHIYNGLRRAPRTPQSAEPLPWHVARSATGDPRCHCARRRAAAAAAGGSAGSAGGASYDGARLTANLSGMDLNQLQTALALAIENEDYGAAAAVRDAINSATGNKAASIDWAALGLPEWLFDRAQRLGYRFPTGRQPRRFSCQSPALFASGALHTKCFARVPSLRLLLQAVCCLGSSLGVNSLRFSTCSPARRGPAARRAAAAGGAGRRRTEPDGQR